MLLMDAHDIAPQLKSHSRLMKPDAEIIIFKAVSDNDFIRVLKSILEKYGDDLNGYRLPWRFFITNNSSVKRQHVADLGLFDEGHCTCRTCTRYSP
jgi:hypothetical protein